MFLLHFSLNFLIFCACSENNFVHMYTGLKSNIPISRSLYTCFLTSSSSLRMLVMVPTDSSALLRKSAACRSLSAGERLFLVERRNSAFSAPEAKEEATRRRVASSASLGWTVF